MKKKNIEKENKQKGFTLIELLIVIAIIGLLASVVLASLNGVEDRKDANYKVRFDSKSYYVESYTKESQGKCVFLSEFEKRFCGDWSVEKINQDE